MKELNSLSMNYLFVQFLLNTKLVLTTIINQLLVNSVINHFYYFRFIFTVSIRMFFLIIPFFTYLTAIAPLKANFDL